MLNWLKQLFRPVPAEVTHIVVVGPSPFRWAETYILGPYTFAKAKRVARREIAHHPYGVANVWSRYGTIMQGDKVFRPADLPDSPVTEVIDSAADYWGSRP